jgi:hypothetical protein
LEEAMLGFSTLPILHGHRKEWEMIDDRDSERCDGKDRSTTRRDTAGGREMERVDVMLHLDVVVQYKRIDQSSSDHLIPRI